jgi:hypothetical protein
VVVRRRRSLHAALARTSFFDGLKLAMLPLYAKVGVFHLIDSVTRPSAPRMMSRARRIVASSGWPASSSHRSTSGFRFIRARYTRDDLAAPSGEAAPQP